MKKTLYFLLFLMVANFAKSQSIIYVDQNATGNSDGSSWADAFTTISDGLAFATTNDEVWVAKGSYTPSVAATYTTPLVISNTGVMLRGGFEGIETTISERDITKIHTDNATIITGDYNGNDIDGDFTATNKNDNAPNLIRVNANNTTVDGVILQNAYTSGNNPVIIASSNRYHFSITNTIIKENYSDGIFFDWRVFSGNLSIKNTSIINNKANHGIMLIQLSSTNRNPLNSYLINVLFANNTYNSDFGAIWFRKVTDTSLAGNHTVANCTFVNNVNINNEHAHLINVSGDGTNNIQIYNSIFWDNKYQTTNISDHDIFNSKTVEGNTQNVTIKNSIIKLPADIDDVTVNSLVTENLSTANPNLDADYLPTDMSDEVINKGGNALYGSTYPALDLAGNSRIEDTTIDLGAYEYSTGCTDIITIPDANFETALLNHDPVIDTNGDGLICRDEAEAFTGRIVSSVKNISDLTGIEAFINITELFVGGNSLSSIDLSQNTALTTLYCQGNNLSSIDISHNTALRLFSCEANQITSLDLSANTQLENLRCSNNQLSALDVSDLSSLGTLGCYNNQITNIDLSNNGDLRVLTISGNSLTTLDVSANTLLSDLNCSFNQLTNLDLSNNLYLRKLQVTETSLTNLDLSLNTYLEELFCNNNQLATLNIANGNNANISIFRADNNPDLICIKIDAGFTPPTSWITDASASFDENCGTATNVEDYFTEDVKIYPNPASDYILIQSQDAIQEVILYSVTGAEVKRTTQDAISLTDLPNGLYIVKVISNKDEVAVKRFLKK